LAADQFLFTRSKTTGIDPHPEDSALFQARWQQFLEAGDPYFNPGLNQNSTTWQMRQPMRCSFEIRRRIFNRDPSSGRQTMTSGS
jgi:O-antigen biosynthesis protein